MTRPFKIGQDVIAEVKRGDTFVVLPGIFRQYGITKKGEVPSGVVDLWRGHCAVVDMVKIKAFEPEIAPIDAPVEFSPSPGEPGN